MVLTATPLGMLLAGSLIAAIGLAGVLLAIAACYLVTTASLFFNSVLLALDGDKAPPPG